MSISCSGRFSWGFGFLAYLLIFTVILTDSAYARRMEKIKKSRELRSLLADIDDMRSPNFALLNSPSQRKRLKDLKASDQAFISLGLDKKLWAGFQERINLQLKLMDSVSSSADAKSWHLLAIDLWQILAQIVSLDFVPPGTPSMEKGAEIFAKHCQECHGTQGNGEGVLKSKLPFKVARFDNQRFIPDDTVIRFFTHTTMGRRERGMPAFEDVLSNEEIWNAAFYVQSLQHTCTDSEKIKVVEVYFAKHEEKFLEQFNLRQLVFESDDWLVAKSRRIALTDDGQNLLTLRCVLPFYKKLKRY